MIKKISSYFITALIISLGSASIVACAYRPDLAQGNFIEQKDVDKLRIGMTKEQVKFVLGTPMLTNQLQKKKWYYLNYLRKGWEEPSNKRLIITFDENERLIEATGDFTLSSEFYTPL